MISILTGNYSAVVRAAEQQAVRSAMPLDGKQSVQIDVQSPMDANSIPVEGTTAAGATAGRIVNVLV